MVRKVITVVLVCCIICANTICTYAATFTCYDGSISSTYLDMFDNIVLDFDDDYVMFRSEQYMYYLVAGKLECNNGVFTSDSECQVYNISQYVHNNNYQSYYMIDNYTIDSFYLDTDGKLVYSNLGNLPSLYDVEVLYSSLIIVALCVIIISFIVKDIFKFVLRNKRGDL